MSHDVFISYSSKDKSLADVLCSALEAGGVRCWITPRNVLLGMDWGEAIIDAIAASRLMVLLLSSNSNASAHVRREVERAVSKNLTVIPFRIENVTLSKTLEYNLSSTHWMDASTPPVEKHLQTLAETIRQLLSISIPTVSKTALSPPDRVVLTIELNRILFLSGWGFPIEVILDGKQVGTVTETEKPGTYFGKIYQASVETTTGMHVLELTGKGRINLNEQYRINLSSGGNYKAFFSDSHEGIRDQVKLKVTKSTLHNPFNPKAQ